MGLDAVVFRNHTTLAQVLGVTVLETDPATGEALSVSGGSPAQRELAAIRTRLGNVSEIAALREIVSETGLHPDSIVLRKVLFTGSHAGDMIEVTEFPELKAELESLRLLDDPRLAQFISAMTDLLMAGEQEENPIVFV